MRRRRPQTKYYLVRWDDHARPHGGARFVGSFRARDMAVMGLWACEAEFPGPYAVYAGYFPADAIAVMNWLMRSQGWADREGS